MKMPTITLNREMLSRFEEAIQKEWIVTNGLGGYASCTVLGINTRKYHGLLVSAFHPPGDRRVCLEKLDEEVCIGNDFYPLGANEFRNGIFPQGHSFVKEFSVSPFPKYVYVVQNVEVEKAVFMPFERNAVVVLYKILNKCGVDIKIRVFPLMNFRYLHSATKRWKVAAEPVQKHENREVHVSLGSPKSTLMMKAIGGRYVATGKWVESIYYREEDKRGESCLDDCYQTGFFEFDVKANKVESFAISAVADEEDDVVRRIASEIPVTLYDIASLFEREVARRENYLTRFYGTHGGIQVSDWLSELILATDTFTVKGAIAEQTWVIAGYHWFESWGRDTFVSLPGLMLVTGRFEDARKVFLGFREYCRHGLIPSFIPDPAGEPVYNSVDAALWSLNAVLQYLKYTNDFGFVQEQLWETLKDIVDGHVKGTAFDIRVDGDGLLSHGERLTWMDAAVNGRSVTPRAGKAVEIQALWYNALRIMELLANRFSENGQGEEYMKMAESARKSFAEKFWNAEKNCLLDVVGENEKDMSLRPNQIVEIALDFTMLDNVKGEKVVDVVQRELLTPYGLRTLSRNDSRYKGVYAGDRRSRDEAYHNGTAWPWLLGPLTTAFLKTKGYADFRRDYAMKTFLGPLLTRQVFEAGLGNVSEIFDGDSPHTPRGCIAQAWSVAEPLRAYVEDVMQIRPKYEKEVLQSSR
jgi:predicted glycogen debranching enzyme